MTPRSTRHVPRSNDVVDGGFGNSLAHDGRARAPAASVATLALPCLSQRTPAPFFLRSYDNVTNSNFNSFLFGGCVCNESAAAVNQPMHPPACPIKRTPAHPPPRSFNSAINSTGNGFSYGAKCAIRPPARSSARPLTRTRRGAALTRQSTAPATCLRAAPGERPRWGRGGGAGCSLLTLTPVLVSTATTRRPADLTTTRSFTTRTTWRRLVPPTIPSPRTHSAAAFSSSFLPFGALLAEPPEPTHSFNTIVNGTLNLLAVAKCVRAPCVKGGG